MRTASRFVAFFVVGGLAYAGSARAAERPTRPPLPIAFQPNVGQAAPDARFIARAGAAPLDLLPDGFRLSGKAAALRLRFLGSRDAALTGLDPIAARVNYFVGANPSRWRRGVPQYERVRYARLYDGIDAVFHADGGGLEYDFEIAPGADPARIAFAFDGARSIAVDPSGDLLIRGRAAVVRQARPMAYQVIGAERRSVDARYVVARRRVTIALGAYDRSQPLVIDPTLVYSTYLGGPGFDGSTGALDIDASGFLYLTFPSGPSALALDICVMKLASDGRTPVYTTYVGGPGNEFPSSVAAAADGSVYVTGSAGALGFPLVHAQPVTVDIGAFLIHLSDDGSALLFSTFFVPRASFGAGVATAADGSVFWAGTAYEAGMFTSAGALQPAFHGDRDGFIAHFSASGTPLAATYLGGTFADSITALALGADGAVYVAGATNSPDLPATAGAFQTTGSNKTCTSSSVTFRCPDAWAAKLSPDLAKLAYLTYLRETDLSPAQGTPELVHALAVDGSGQAYVTGVTRSPSFPTTPGAFDTVCGSDGTCAGLDNLAFAEGDVFVTKINPNGTGLSYSTFLGGTQPSGGAQHGSTIVVDADGHAYVGGHTTASNFPVVLGRPGNPGAGAPDGFVSRFSLAGDVLEYSSYLGGNGWEDVFGLRLAAGEKLWVFGWTMASNFPLVAPVRDKLSGPSDMFLAAIDLSTPAASLDSPAAGEVVQPFLVGGWALDRMSCTDAGVDAVHVYAYPDPGSGKPPIFVGAARVGEGRPDVAAAYGSRYSSSGFDRVVNGLPAGAYLVAVFGRSTVSGRFTLIGSRAITVVVPPVDPRMAIDGPVRQAPQPFTISGWAIDYAAAAGTGVDAVHVWAYPNPGSGTPPIWIGAATYGLPRPDVGAAFGDPRFGASGYEVNVSGLVPGIYDFVVFAHNAQAGKFNDFRVVQLTVR